MQVISFEQAKQQFDALCEQVYKNHQTYMLHRANNHDVVLLSVADYHLWQERWHDFLVNPSHAPYLWAPFRHTPAEDTSWSTDPSSTSPAFPKFGSAKGLIEMTADFDEPLEDFQEYMP